MDLLIPWMQNPQTSSEKVAFNLINTINFSIQRLNNELTSINDQLNGDTPSSEIISAMGSNAAIFTAYQLATMAYIDALATILNTSPSIINGEAPPSPDAAFKIELNTLTKDGYTDPILSIKIVGDDTAMKERWSPLVTSILNFISLGVPNTQTTTFLDYNGNPITITFLEFQQLMSRYAVWFNARFMIAAGNTAP